MKERQRRRRNAGRKRPMLSAAEIFTTLELSDSAIKKLHLGEEISDAELSALFRSDYLRTTDAVSLSASITQELYSVPAEPSSVRIICPNAELEILAYFGSHPEQLYVLPPRKFEELVASVFRNNGFDVELTPQTRDGGVDIIAIERSSLTGRAKHLIECKRYDRSNKVGIGILQRMLGVVEHHRATKGILVTTSSFSRDATIFAEFSQHRLALSDYNIVVGWLRSFGTK